MTDLLLLQRSARFIPILKTGLNISNVGKCQNIHYFRRGCLKEVFRVNYLLVDHKCVRSRCLHIGISYYVPSRVNLKIPQEIIDELGENFEHVESKIMFNSLLEYEKIKVNRIKRYILKDIEVREKLEKINTKDPISNIPVALKYITQTSETRVCEENEEKSGTGNEVMHLPYSTGIDLSLSNSRNVQMDSDKNNVMDGSEQNLKSERNVNSSELHPLPVREYFIQPRISNWMSDYECYDEYEEENIVNTINSKSWEFNYGTPRKDAPTSNVPCGGCGALLHCRDTAIPGYLPSEIFERQDEATLRSIVCQRCHFLRVYNTALNVIVSPDDYPKLLGHVKNAMALIILMIDVLDFPCSVWPGIVDIVGYKHPIIVVANKVDLLPPDSKGYLHRVKECVSQSLNSSGIPERNIKHISLISAKTGYGVEELITKLHNLWKYRGDVYVVGCTNVGKSTLFNALLQSDLCKVKAVDLVQRATTSPWPGTTINLLKFPILRPSGWQLYERTKRIVSQRQQIAAQQKLHRNQLQESTTKSLPALIGHIGMTFYNKDPVLGKDVFNMGGKFVGHEPFSGLNPAAEEFAQSKWCYDTPGAVHPEQAIHLLTTEELMRTLPKTLLLPKTFRMKPNMTIFIAGLGRLDYLQGDYAIKMTVFASKRLPVTICHLEDADFLYETLLGSKLMGVPCGGQARLAQWPGLTACSGTIQLQGIGWRQSCGDIVLSSAGWIAITLGQDKKCEFRAWTPGGRGIYIRQPALLPFAVTFSGPKVRASPAYRKGPAMFKKEL